MSEFQSSNFIKENGGTPDLLGKTELTSPYFFVPPSGTTEERPQSCAPGTIRFNTDIQTLEIYRGDTVGWEQIQRQPSAIVGTRGLISGSSQPANSNVIQFLTIATVGNASDFGDMQEAKQFAGSCASHTRGLIGGGNTGSNVITIDFLTVATLGDGQNFGDLTVARSELGCTSNSVRGIFAGGYNPSLTSNTSFITIATLGNSNNFGDLTVARRGIGAAASSTRAAFGGGQHPSSPNNTNTIDYVAIATTGDAIDFGDLGQSNSGQKRNVSGCSNGHGGL